jgi:hypothetical protein
MSLQSRPEGDELVDDPFAYVNVRIRWANSDGKAANELSEWFVNTGAYAIWVEHDGDRWRATFRRLCDPTVEKEKLDDLARHLGSFLDHSRAALNYAVYQLALLAIRENPALNSPETPRKERLVPETVEYPIVRTRKQFRYHNGIRNLPHKYRRAIEQVQPYDGKNQGLWILQELGREYRHRLVHSAAVAPVADMHHVLVNGALIATPDMTVCLHERLKDGDVILRFSLPGLEPGANVKPQIVLTVGIDHILTSGIPSLRVLNEIRTDAERALDAIEPLLA